jgi:hypothetical protein
MGERNPRLNDPVWVFEDQACNRNMVYEKGPLGAWKEIENNPQIVKFLGGKRYKPNEHAGEIHLVVDRAPVGEDTSIPRYPAAHLQLDLGIVPSAQEPTTISNWLQDGVIARMQAAHPQDKSIDDKARSLEYSTTPYSSGGGICTWCTR